jgi:hypothetical protein
MHNSKVAGSRLWNHLHPGQMCCWHGVFRRLPVFQQRGKPSGGAASNEFIGQQWLVRSQGLGATLFCQRSKGRREALAKGECSWSVREPPCHVNVLSLSRSTLLSAYTHCSCSGPRPYQGPVFVGWAATSDLLETAAIGLKCCLIPSPSTEPKRKWPQCAARVAGHASASAGARVATIEGRRLVGPLDFTHACPLMAKSKVWQVRRTTSEDVGLRG